MKLINNYNFKVITLFIENYNDLWVLSQILNKDDIVKGETDRKIKIGSEENYKIVRKKFNVTLKILETNIVEETLEIKGIVLNENDYISKGSEYFLRLKYGNKITIEKDFLDYEKKILKDSLNKKNESLLILVDNNCLLVSSFSDNNYKVLLNREDLGIKKMFQESQNKDDIDIKFELIKDLVNKNYENVILAGPGFWKNLLQEKIKKELNKSVDILHWNDVSESSIQKVINEINKKGIIKDNKLALESSLINELNLNIAKNKLYSYGEENVLQNSYIGSVDKLLISSNFIDKKKKENKYSEIKDLISIVEKQKGKVYVLNSNYEPGKVLDGLGGIGAILRF